MPGVKRLHQESEDVSKPEWIRGHYFNALSILLSAGGACFAVPLILRLQDGLTPQAPAKAKAKKDDAGHPDGRPLSDLRPARQLCGVGCLFCLRPPS